MTFGLELSYDALTVQEEELRMLVELVVAALVLLGLLYRYITKSFDKWKKLGIPHDPPSFPFGTHRIFDGTKNINEYVRDDYLRFKVEQRQSLHGWFMFGKPVLSINDVGILKQLMVKDFNHFVDRSEENTSRVFRGGGDLDKVGQAVDGSDPDVLGVGHHAV